MSTTRADLSRWFDAGVEQGATHMIVVCDTFDWSDYPVYVAKNENVREKARENMQKVMEVYSLTKDKTAQLGEHRAFNYD